MTDKTNVKNLEFMILFHLLLTSTSINNLVLNQVTFLSCDFCQNSIEEGNDLPSIKFYWIKHFLSYHLWGRQSCNIGCLHVIETKNYAQKSRSLKRVYWNLQLPKSLLTISLIILSLKLTFPFHNTKWLVMRCDITISPKPNGDIQIPSVDGFCFRTMSSNFCYVA